MGCCIGALRQESWEGRTHWTQDVGGLYCLALPVLTMHLSSWEREINISNNIFLSQVSILSTCIFPLFLLLIFIYFNLRLELSRTAWLTAAVCAGNLRQCIASLGLLSHNWSKFAWTVDTLYMVWVYFCFVWCVCLKGILK